MKGLMFLFMLLLWAMIFSTHGFAQVELRDWTFTSSMNLARAEVAVATDGKYVYAIGGHAEWGVDPYASVERAPILPDGSLGKWQLDPNPLPIPVYGSVAVYKGGYIYLVSGNLNWGNPTSAVQYASIQPDGSLSPWQETSPVTQRRVNHDVVEYGGYLYAIGGNPPVKGLTSVEYARILEDGSLGPWTQTSPNNYGRWLVGAEAYNGYIYVFGGAWTETVEYAQIQVDGSLGPWNYTAPFSAVVLGCPASVVSDGYLYVIAGDYNSAASDRVDRAHINGDGTLGAWTELENKLPESVSCLGHCNYAGSVYVVGGYHTTTGSDDVQRWSMRSAVEGDADCNFRITISDVVYLINYIFAGGAAPGCAGGF